MESNKNLNKYDSPDFRIALNSFIKKHKENSKRYIIDYARKKSKGNK
jgi:hypothetical protein